MSADIPEGSAAELMYRLQSQRLFTRTLQPCRDSFCIGYQQKKRARGGQQLMLKKNGRKLVDTQKSAVAMVV